MKRLIASPLAVLILSSCGGSSSSPPPNFKCKVQALSNAEPKKNFIPVLIYHNVSSNFPESYLSISPERFKSHLDRINQLGYQTITASQAGELIGGGMCIPPKLVSLTFDDGTAEMIDTAVMLRNYSMTATFYIISGFFDIDGYLSGEQVRDISVDFEIGAHSHTHYLEWQSNLPEIPSEKLTSEAQLSKLLLEEVTGKPIVSYAWPFGYYRDELISTMKNFGFTSLLTTETDVSSKNTKGSDPMKIQRLLVDGFCTADDIEKMLVTGRQVKCRE